MLILDILIISLTISINFYSYEQTIFIKKIINYMIYFISNNGNVECVNRVCIHTESG